MSTPKSSGRIMLEHDTVLYTAPHGDTWQVSVPDLRVIGEFTNDHGPVVDDYFFVFITRQQWFEASFYADGCDSLLAELGRRLHHELRAGLCRSTILASRVLWPARLEGQPLFDFVPEERAGTILRRFRQRVLPRVHMHLMDQVRRELES